MHLVHQRVEIAGAAKSRELGASGRIETFLKIHTLFQVIQSRKDFSKVLMSDGKEVERGAAIREDRQQALHKFDLVPNLSCIGRLGRSASNLFRLLSKKGESGKSQNRNQRKKNGEEACEFHRERFDAADGCAAPGLTNDK